MENKLKYEKSLYLIRHAENPVYWQAWNEETINLAKKENKPIFLSIGYSSCHWCRVMEKESFEDNNTADILNEKFIPVKMDKDEFPDVDKEYQFYIQSTGEDGGWPLSVFLTPDKEPFFAGTYFPKEKSHGRPAFKDVLNNISDIYTNKYNEVEKVIKTRNDFISSFYKTTPSLIPEDKIAAYRKNEYMKIFDPLFFGFREGPKFPYISSMNYLVENYHDDDYALFLNNTADKICTMGLCDHIFGGFFRYTVDRMWQIPHFEKMLSDNSLVASFLLTMYENTRNRLYLYTAQKAVDFILYNSMRSDYGFLDSLDADSLNSNGDYEEGYYYKVTDRDFTVLNEKELKNFPTEAGVHNGVIYLKHNEYIKAAALDVSLKKIAERINSVKTAPQADNKVISGHNFLFCTTLLNLYSATNEEYYFEQALSLYHKLSHLLTYKGRVYRGLYAIEDEINKSIKANAGNDDNNFMDKFIINHRVLSDHVYFLETSLKFYELTQEENFLLTAKAVVAEIENEFVKDGIPHLDIYHRVKDTFDDDKPNPIGLYLYLTVKHSYELEFIANEKLIELAQDRTARFPTGHATMIRALELLGR